MKRSKELAEHLNYFKELGVTGVSRDPLWRFRSDPSDGATNESTSVTSLSGSPRHLSTSMPNNATIKEDESSAGRLQVIREDLGECDRCELHTTRTKLVYGVGNPDADLMFVGEAPGRDEDRQGIPFVGRAGQLLTKIIESIDLCREDVYIANVIKCRPPENRNPTPDEVQTCEPFLFAQVDAIEPRVIVALGSFATRTLLRTEETISKLRGQIFTYRGAQLIPTFHPAFLLRSPDHKREVWQDMKKVRAILRSG